jgi:hypothetical protein
MPLAPAHGMLERRTAELLVDSARLATVIAALVTSACGGSSDRIEAAGATAGAGGTGATGGAGGDRAAGGTGGSGATGGSGGTAGAGAAAGEGGATGGTGGSTGGGGSGGNAMGGAGAGGSSGGAGGAGAGGGGATAGSSGGGAGGDGGGGANAGNGGAGGIVCMAQTGFAQRLPDPDVRETTTGNNGTFTDECDAEGKLKEYYCEYQELCGSMNDCASYPTGKVLPRTTTCMFVCGAGACMYPAE